jgi:hypothetical protein
MDLLAPVPPNDRRTYLSTLVGQRYKKPTAAANVKSAYFFFIVADPFF